MSAGDITQPDTITISCPDIYNYDYHVGNLTASTISTVSINTDYLSEIDIGNINISDEYYRIPTEFVNTFPDWEKINKMRSEYPALDIALKKFQEVYTMVEDDWQAQQGQKYRDNT